jgi:hypothetical protein
MASKPGKTILSGGLELWRIPHAVIATKSPLPMKMGVGVNLLLYYDREASGRV